MHNFVNLENLKSSKVEFDPAMAIVDRRAHWPTISEMVAEAQKTGQMPYSNLRQALPPDEDIDGNDFVVSDQIDATVFARQLADDISSKEAELEELKKKEKAAQQPAE